MPKTEENRHDPNRNFTAPMQRDSSTLCSTTNCILNTVGIGHICTKRSQRRTLISLVAMNPSSLFSNVRISNRLLENAHNTRDHPGVWICACFHILNCSYEIKRILYIASRVSSFSLLVWQRTQEFMHQLFPPKEGCPIQLPTSLLRSETGLASFEIVYFIYLCSNSSLRTIHRTPILSWIQLVSHELFPTVIRAQLLIKNHFDLILLWLTTICF